MALPEKIQVKISSEAAGSVSITPVVRQEIAAAALIENILRVTGKDPSRIRDILRQGTIVQGASRFRWTPIEALPEEIARVLESFPDPQPDRSFDSSRCVRVRLTGGRAAIDIDREAASRKRLFSRRSFWQAMMEIASGLPPVYYQYSYGERADIYQGDLTPDAVRAIRESAGLLRYTTLEKVVREYAYHRLELWVER